MDNRQECVQVAVFRTDMAESYNGLKKFHFSKNGEDDIDYVVNSEGEHQLVEVHLQHVLVEPEDGQTVALQAKQSS